ncbi:hypothetical protein ABK040_001772 [Willaertia magna]
MDNEIDTFIMLRPAPVPPEFSIENDSSNIQKSSSLTNQRVESSSLFPTPPSAENHPNAIPNYLQEEERSISSSRIIDGGDADSNYNVRSNSSKSSNKSSRRKKNALERKIHRMKEDLKNSPVKHKLVEREHDIEEEHNFTFIKKYFSQSSKSPFLVNRTLNKEFLKFPYFTLVMSVVQIIMFVVCISIGGVESVVINPLIGPKEEVLLTFGAKQGQLIIAPNWQVYRLITPVFLHGGIVHLGLNVMWQLSVMLPLERHWGFAFTAFIYSISAVGGNLLSALFLPRIITVGASSALFGILGAMFADLIINWKYMPSPKKDFTLIGLQVIAQVLVGLIPWIDNFAHVGGLIVGFFTTLGCIPSMRDPNPYIETIERNRKKLLREDDLEKGNSSLSRQYSNEEEVEEETPRKYGKTTELFRYLFTHRKCVLVTRVLSVSTVICFFIIFGGLYFSRANWECSWCYIINPDWQELESWFNTARDIMS